MCYFDDFDGVILGIFFMDIFLMLKIQYFQINQLFLFDVQIFFEKLFVIQVVVMQVCDGIDGMVDGLVQMFVVCFFVFEMMICFGVDDVVCISVVQVKVLCVYFIVFYIDDGQFVFLGYVLVLFDDGFLNFQGGKELVVDVMVVELWGNDGFVFVLIEWLFFDYIIQYLVKYDLFFNVCDLGILFDGMVLCLVVEEFIVRMVVGNGLDLVVMQVFLDVGKKMIFYYGWGDYVLLFFCIMCFVDDLVWCEGGMQVLLVKVWLFMVFDMGYCCGGIGFDVFNMLVVLEVWVEQGIVFDVLVVEKLDDSGVVIWLMLFCFYLVWVEYFGMGDVMQVVNWSCIVNIVLLQMGSVGILVGLLIGGEFM